MAKIVFIAVSDTPSNKPLSVSILSGVVKKSGHDFVLFNTADYQLEDNNTNDSIAISRLELKEAANPERLPPRPVVSINTLISLAEGVVSQSKPDIIGFSCLSDDFPLALAMAGAIKERFALPIIFGGIHATVKPGIINDAPIDIVCVGEGEQALVELLDAIGEGKIRTDIKNLTFKVNGKLITNPSRPLIQNLDELPFLDWAEYSPQAFYKPYMGHVYKYGDFNINRGCPYPCSYCINNYLREMAPGQKQAGRRKSLDYLFAELSSMVSTYQIEFIKFWDETFLLMNKEFMTEFSKRYAAEIGLPYTIETTAESITMESARMLADSNCVSASIGLETGSSRLRKEILGKKTSNTQYANCYDILGKFGIRKSSFFMFFIPAETVDEIWENVSVTRAWKLDTTSCGILYPYLGTKIRGEAIRNGWLNEKALLERESRHTQSFTQSETVFEFDLRQMIASRHLYDNFGLYVTLPENRWNEIVVAQNNVPRLNELYREAYRIRFGE